MAHHPRAIPSPDSNADNANEFVLGYGRLVDPSLWDSFWVWAPRFFKSNSEVNLAHLPFYFCGDEDQIKHHEPLDVLGK